MSCKLFRDFVCIICLDVMWTLGQCVVYWRFIVLLVCLLCHFRQYRNVQECIRWVFLCHSGCVARWLLLVCMRLSILYGAASVRWLGLFICESVNVTVLFTHSGLRLPQSLEMTVETELIAFSYAA